MSVILYFLKKNWIRFLVATVFATAPVIIYLAVNQAWTLAIGYCNSFFISGFFLTGVSALVALNLFGAFDIFSFYFGRKLNEQGKKEDLYEYSTRKKEERWKAKLAFLPYLIVGAICLIASLIIYFTL